MSQKNQSQYPKFKSQQAHQPSKAPPTKATPQQVSHQPSKAPPIKATPQQASHLQKHSLSKPVMKSKYSQAPALDVLDQFEHESYEEQLLGFALSISYPLGQYGQLKEALTHRSFSNEKKLDYDNQRLEFLGDAVVNLVTARELTLYMQGSDEGNLSNARARIVNEYCLAKMSELVGIDRLLRVGKGEGKLGDKAKLVRLADAFESVTAAIYLDLGYQVAYDWVWHLLKIPFLVLLEQGHLSDLKIKEISDLTDAEIEQRMNHLQEVSESKTQFQTLKTQLQEKLQAIYHENPTYLTEALPKQKYQYQIYINTRLLAQAQGNTIKSAEWEAVKKAWQFIHSPDFDI